MKETAGVVDSSSPQKIKVAFWTVFGVSYMVGIVVVQLALRKFHVPIESSSLGFPTLAACYVLTVLAFRKRGTPVVNQSVQVLTKEAAIEGEGVSAQCELHMDRKSWRWITVACGGCMAFLGVLAMAFPPKSGEWIGVGTILAFSAIATMALAAMGWLRTSLIARVDKTGITTVTGWNSRRFVPWSQIESCQQIQNSFLLFNSTGLAWKFQDALGNTIVQVTPLEAPEAKQREFAQVVARYLSPSVVA